MARACKSGIVAVFGGEAGGWACRPFLRQFRLANIGTIHGEQHGRSYYSELSVDPSRLDTFIFDFDGTLADSMDHVVPLYNSVAERLGVPKVTPEDVQRLRRMAPLDAMRAYGVPMWKVPRILHEVTLRLREQIDRLEPFRGIADTLFTLRGSGARCLIVSSNSRDNIEAFLQRHQLQLFERLACGSSMFGKGKRLRRVLAQASLIAANVAYVGDEVRDIEAAKNAGVCSVGVSWGYTARDALVAANPDFLIDRPEQLLELRSGTLAVGSIETPT